MKLSTITLLSGLLLASATATAQTSKTITLTTYNIHSAIPDGYNAGNYWPSVSDLQNVADVLTTAGADIVGLQEVRNLWDSQKHPREGEHPINFPHYLSGLLNMEYAFGSGLEIIPARKNPEGRRIQRENRNYIEWGTAHQYTNNGARLGNYGNAILSNLPLSTPPQLIKLPRGTDEEAIRRTDEPRTALRVELQEPLGSLGHVVIYNTHFQHNNSDTRQMQIEHLLEHARADLAPGSSTDASTVTVFLIGDFNHTPRFGEDPFLDTIKDAGFHDLAQLYADKTNTQPRSTIGDPENGRRIDYIFCSRPLDATEATVLISDVSDHRPLNITITY